MCENGDPSQSSRSARFDGDQFGLEWVDPDGAEGAADEEAAVGEGVDELAEGVDLVGVVQADSGGLFAGGPVEPDEDHVAVMEGGQVDRRFTLGDRGEGPGHGPLGVGPGAFQALGVAVPGEPLRADRSLAGVAHRQQGGLQGVGSGVGQDGGVGEVGGEHQHPSPKASADHSMVVATREPEFDG